jgi:hypothetical protein
VSHGFRDDGTDTAGLNDANNRGEHMDEEDDQITHAKC